MANLAPFSKVLQKQAGRAKERLLQNLGKADRTTDEDFDLHVKNFSKQQVAVSRLQKEFKNFYLCLKAMQIAKKSLIDTISQLYEPDWDGVEEFLIKSDISNRTLEDFCESISTSILEPVGNYLNKFPEINNKISKRNRKLLDYDKCRHNLQNLETMKKREDSKLSKAKEQLDDARNSFDSINKELHDDLPSFHDGRIEFFSTYLQQLFVSENKYHVTDALVCGDIGDLLGKLRVASKVEMCSSDSEKEYFCATESSLASKNIINSQGDGNVIVEDKQDTNQDVNAKVEESNGLKTIYNPMDGSKDEIRNQTTDTLNKSCTVLPKDETAMTIKEEDSFSSESPSESTTFSTPTTTFERNSSLDLEVAVQNIPADKTMPEKLEKNKVNADEKSRLTLKPTGKCLYQVEVTFQYAAVDEDELSFDVGDIIDVIEYDDPDEQEDGWLMGLLNGKKGLFPANFTTRI